MPLTISVQGLKPCQSKTAPSYPYPLPAQLLEGDDEIGEKIPGPADDHQVEAQMLAGPIRALPVKRRLDDKGSGDIAVEAEPFGIRRDRRVEDEPVGVPPGSLTGEPWACPSSPFAIREK